MELQFAASNVWIALAVIGAAILSALSWREIRALPNRFGWLVLRLATLTFALLLVARPTSVIRESRVLPGSLAVLVDGSRSMTIGARESETRDLLSRWNGAKNRAFPMFSFGTELKPLEGEWAPVEDRSDFANAISDLLDDEGSQDLGAVVVVSDGSFALDSVRLDFLKRRGIRLHTVSVGKNEDLRDIAIGQLEKSSIAYLRQPYRVSASVQSVGIPLEGLRATLRLDGDVIETESIAVDEAGRGSVDFEFTPQRIGKFAAEISIPAQSNDALLQNNSRSFMIEVRRDRLRALLVSGSPSWDERFLREFLKRDASIDLVSFFILRTRSDLTLADPDELSLIPFPTDELFREHLASFDVVIFQNFEFGPYDMAPYLPRVRDYVLRGGSFAMIGGEQSFASGGYHSTELENVLPVDLSGIPREGEGAFVLGVFQPSLSSGKSRHPLVALDSDEARSAERWAELAPLAGLNAIHALRPWAVSLLEHPTARSRGGAPMPVLAVGEIEKGRVLALLTDSSYRWGMPSASDDGDPSTFAIFWDKAVRWLSRDPTLEPSRCSLDRDSFSPGAPLRADALLANNDYQPVANESVEVRIERGANRSATASRARTDSDGNVSWKTTAPRDLGPQRVVFEGGANIQCTQWFIVEAGGSELADPRAHPEHMEELARRTGGQFVEAADAQADLSKFEFSRVKTLSERSYSWMAHPAAILAGILLFFLEWGLRRRRGLR